MKTVKRIIRILLWVGSVFLLLSIFWNIYVSKSAEEYIFKNLDGVEDRHVGLLLGTSKYAVSGQQNLYYKYRIEAAAKLYKIGMIDYVLVSGDNATIYYNEPAVMLNDLKEAGVPKDCIIQDFAGFRTLDSMIRSKKVFGQDKITVISQEFHLERAIFLANRSGIDAIGFCADDVDTYYGAKTMIREHFARIKMFIDLYILHTEPKFLGDPIQIPS